jgi:uncharacterized protein involved in tolerance to divalent cations
MHYQSAKMAKANDNVLIDIPTMKVANPCSNYENPQIEAMPITAGSKAFIHSPLLAITTPNLWAGGI